ncbi:MAG: alpha/beta hydrolase [Clostridiales bacterium]|nr:alpha/beta hydrolase [Clostridiales bacterium]
MRVFIGKHCKGGEVILINHIQFGQGEDIIFLHGWGGSIQSFLGIANRLKNNYRVTLVDFYGFGDTPPKPYPIYLEDYAESILDIIEHYKMRQVILVGHSFGGRVAIKFASRYSHLLQKIVLVDSAGIKPRRKLSYYFKIFRHKLLNLLNIEHTAGSADYRKLDSVAKQTFKNIINEDLTPITQKITLPVLIFWGGKDKETPIYMARKLYKNLVCSTLIVFKGLGHYAYIERQNQFYMLLKSYLLEEHYALADIINNHNLGGSTILKIPHALSKQ